MNVSAPSVREPLPRQFRNLDRLLYSMKQRDLDAVVVTTPFNVFYLSGFNAVAHKSDEPRPYAVVLSRRAPDHPVIIVADYYVGSLLAQPSWIEDVRSFRAVMMPLDLPATASDVDRFIPSAGDQAAWVPAMKERFAPACRAALSDLGIVSGRIGFDDMRFGRLLGIDGVEICDGYDPLMYARSVKTDFEVAKLRAATQINEAAIMLQTGLEDFEVEPGTHIMFDCHGTHDMYCWDGGKTWVVDDEPQGGARRIASATAAASQAVLEAMRPGARISELQALGRGTFHEAGVPDADAAIVFFHGLGLSHMDIEQYTADGKPNVDWQLEEGMVVPLHLLYPGGERSRCWVEEIALVTETGGDPFFGWGFEPLTG